MDSSLNCYGLTACNVSVSGSRSSLSVRRYSLSGVRSISPGRSSDAIVSAHTRSRG